VPVRLLPPPLLLLLRLLPLLLLLLLLLELAGCGTPGLLLRSGVASSRFMSCADERRSS
jgi:hypothetical protein